MRLAVIAAALLCVLALAASAPAQESPPPATASTEAAPVAHPLERADVDTWLDGLLPYALQRGDVAGAVVVVVRDGQVVTQRGFGYANVERRTPMDPETTLVRPGSVSKLFTWTAVMQLVEQNRLDLDADVNTYLDFQIPPRDGQPVTLRSLLTHTAGFEETFKSVIAAEPQQHTLGQRLSPPWTPRRIYAPGSTPAYSNYGTALAGYIVERVSGQPFADYVEQHILQPAGMAHSTFHQPLPEGFGGEMATGYRVASGQPSYFEIVDISPAGGLTASANDMGRFMIAHLQGGAIGEMRILREETATLMHTGTDGVVPNVNHMALGFYERNINGRRVIAHGGDTYFFHSELSLFIDDNVGLFISMNSSGNAAAAVAIRDALFAEFADRYLPGPSPDGQVDEATAREHAQLIAGTYDGSRRNASGIFSMLDLLGDGSRVVAFPDGTITIPDLLGGPPKRYREIAPFVWRQVDGHFRAAAVVENGQVVRFAMDEYPFQVFDRALPNAGLPKLAVMFAIAVLVITALFWPVIAIVRWRYKKPFELIGREAWAYRATRVSALLAGALFISWPILLMAILQDAGHLANASTDGLVTGVRVLSAIIFPLGVVVALWNAFVVWTGKRNWWAKAWSVLLALSFASLLAVAFRYNLVGYNAVY